MVKEEAEEGAERREQMREGQRKGKQRRKLDREDCSLPIPDSALPILSLILSLAILPLPLFKF